jgi:cell division protein FtsN
MTDETPYSPDDSPADPTPEQREHAAAVQRDQAQKDTGQLTAPDQTADDRELTELVGKFQAEAEALGWTSEVVQWGPAPTGVILGFTSSRGRGYSAAFNLTP